jgi:hypothetical protein
MCEICRQNPCHYMCPNAEPRKMVHCCKCDGEFFPEETSEYLTFNNGDIVCNDCLRVYCEENFT